MRILIILILYPFLSVFSQNYTESDLIGIYERFAQIDDLHSLNILNNKVRKLNESGEIKLEGALKDKLLQTHQYLKIRTKLKECLKNSNQEMKMGLDKAILGMLKKDIYNSDTAKTFQNCKQVGQLWKNLEGFKGFLDKTYSSSDRYKYYSDVQGQLYDEAMSNAMKTYADLSRYGFEGTPEEWNEFLYKELRKEFCKPVQVPIDRLKTPQDGSNRVPIFGKTEPNCHSLAKNITQEFSHRERVPLDDAAKMLNESVDQLDEKMMQVRSSMKDRDYLAYKSTYQEILSKSPGTLLLTDVLQSREQGIGALVEEKDIYSNLKPVFHNRIETKNDKHLKILEKALEEAKKKTKKGIAKIHQDFYQRDYDDFEANNYFDIRGTVLKDRRKSDIKKIVTSYPSAAAQVLHDTPLHLYAICEAIINAEKSREKDEKLDKAVMWGGLIVGGFLLATGIGSGTGAVLIVGALSAGYSTRVAIKSYNEYKHHEAALYTNNSHDIQALDKSYKKFKEALIFAAADIVLAVADPKVIKALSKLKPKEIDNVTEVIKELPPNSTKMSS